MSFLVFLLICILPIQDSQVRRIELVVEPAVLAVGKTASLSWSVKGGGKIFVSHVGSVQSSGRIEIKPEQTTTYTLVAEGNNAVFTKTITVDVTGSKGENEFPNETNFKYPIVSKLVWPSFPELLQHIQSVLQDTMTFTLNEYLKSDGQYVFVTNQSQRPDLVKKAETRIGARRIAYLVEVARENPKSEGHTYTIKALIEYRRKVERSWRGEADESMYQQQTRRLQAIINGKP